MTGIVLNASRPSDRQNTMTWPLERKWYEFWKPEFVQVRLNAVPVDPTYEAAILPIKDD